MKIFGGRGGLIGDTIMCLPLIQVLKIKYNYTEITWPICRKCAQASPLYINQDGIQSIYITKDEEWLTDLERDWTKREFDLFINPTPNHPRESDWYNHRSCVEETMLMAGEEYLEDYNKLPEELQKPRLNPWWPKSTNYKYAKKRIAIFPFAGYGKDSHRSPSVDWWKSLIRELTSKNDCNIYHFGHSSEPSLAIQEYWEMEDSEFCNYFDHTHLPLFTQIQLAHECDLVIGTDSGTSWIMGALGVKQISLLTNWLPNHHNNPLALAAINCENKATNLFAPGGCDNIDINKVLKVIENGH